MIATIRMERAEDFKAIFDVTMRAFATMSYADGDEQWLPARFRDAGALALSLVAELDGDVVGQATFTPAFAEDGSGGWFALGPIAVDPLHQSAGIGGDLIRAGIDWMHGQNAAGCVLVGNPAFYCRFGFQRFPKLAPKGELAEFFQILPLGVEQPVSIVNFHPLFYS
jgi:putative acetyltransferase